MADETLPPRRARANTAVTPPAAIETTLGALVNSVAALNRLLELRLPVAAAYHVAKLAKLVDAEVVIYEKQRVALVNEFGVRRAPTAEETAKYGPEQLTAVPEDKRQVFNAGIANLAAHEVTIAWKPLTLAELGAVDISAGDLLALGALLDMDAG